MVIVQPTTPSVIESLVRGFEDTVAPELSDAPAQLAMGMALQVLRTAAARSGNELAWMREESAAIEALATLLLAEIPEGAGPLSAALGTYRDQRTESLYLADAAADYERAGEVLSCATELAYLSGTDEHRTAVHALFEQRLAHENAVTGGYQAVGRS